MRVIAGSLRGRRLKAPVGSSTRPTSERVREALFSMLGDVGGAVVLDLFAGSGALGIEALSRGARRTVFVELEHPAVRVLKGNLAGLGLDSSVAEVRHAEALSALRRACERKETYDLLFIDPPYARARELGQVLAGALPSLLRPGARIVLESDRRAPLDLGMEVERQKRYGDTSITIHRHQ
jgi:16S rRNA (guanine966-N2)-methyltransferase